MGLLKNEKIGYIGSNSQVLDLLMKSYRIGIRFIRKEYRGKMYCGFKELNEFENRLHNSELMSQYPDCSEKDWKMHFLYCASVYGGGAADYFNLEMYKKNDIALKGFVTKYMQWHDIIPFFNTDYYAEINEVLRDKVMFNEKFQDLIHRDFLQIEENTSLDMFKNFLAEKDKYVAKPYNGTCEGNGVVVVYKEQYNTEEKMKSLLGEYKKMDGMMIEGFLEQKGILHDMNPLTVNTMRIVTMYLGNEVDVVFAALKVGNGDTFVDNICKGGLKMPVDLKTGLISGPGVDKDNKHYYYHPYSGIKLLGTKIPNWEKTIETVIEAAKRLPQIPFVGWDVAISDENVSLIEGNQGSSIQDFEFPWEDGYACQFEAYAEKKKKMEKMKI